MENLDYFNLILNSEAKQTYRALGISDERIVEMEKTFMKGYNEFGKAISNGQTNLTKTDLFLFMSRAGFVAQTPNELVYMTLMISEKIIKNELMGQMAEFLPIEIVKQLFSPHGRQDCDCPNCKAQRDEEDPLGFLRDDDEDDDL